MSETHRIRAISLFILLAGLFLIANRGAYQGYFGDDEFDNLALTRAIGPGVSFTALISPSFYENNFRPVGHLFYRLLAATAGLHYPPYIAGLHLLHIINLVLLWLILRRMAVPFWAAAVATLFFAFHMGVFDIYWRPEYVYDLLCGTFCLLSLLAWLYDRWLIALLAFWLAYRSKEIAVMLPAVLAAYELLLSKRRWLRLIPFVAISLWFGVQGLIVSSRQNNPYSMHYGLSGIAKSVLFYSSRLLLMPYAGIALLVLLISLAVFLKDRRIWFGIIAFLTLLLPMVLLSERLAGAYLYVPLIGLAISLGAVATYPRAALAVALAFAFWIPWNYVNLRRLRRDALSQVEDRRRYFSGLADLIRKQPDLTSFLYFDAPLGEWGARGAIRWLHPGAEILVTVEGRPDAKDILRQPELAALYWNKVARRLEAVVRSPATPDASYLDMGSYVPVWQLGDGWFPNEGAYRWTRPHATARLRRPDHADGFEITVNIGPQYLERIHRSHLRASLNGQEIGTADFDHLGYQTVRWKLTPAASGETEIAFDSSPPYAAANPLGSAICSFGFLPRTDGR